MLCCEAGSAQRSKTESPNEESLILTPEPSLTQRSDRGNDAPNRSQPVRAGPNQSQPVPASPSLFEATKARTTPGLDQARVDVWALRLLSALAELGTSAREDRSITATHLHPDHIGLATPGHTPGSPCLRDDERSLLFTGDQVLATHVVEGETAGRMES